MKTQNAESRDVAILGAGLAGLSCAYHLKNKSHVLIEKERSVGGTARSFKIKNFTFDFTGHLLHLHHPTTKNLIRRLLNNQFFSCARKAFVFSNGKRTPYPFQANTFGLPDQVIDDCVLGVYSAHLRNAENKNLPRNFSEWSRHTFGEGISQHFMIPYNQKLYQTPVSKMTHEWCGTFVPTPKLEEVIQGSLEKQPKNFGYNTTFLYPKRGGIQALAESLSKSIKNIRLETKVQKIRWKEKKVYLSTGEEISYETLVNTIPLREFLRLLDPLPQEISQHAEKLKFASILCLNLGINRGKISDASWIYFPEKKFPFYRVGFPMNFTPHVVPRGCSSMYVEIPWKKFGKLPQKKLLAEVRQGLVNAGILKLTDRILVSQFLPIRYAYVIYDHDRQIALPKIFSFLNKNKIHSIGRYGAWKYSFMEEAILDGAKTADLIS